MSRYRTHSLLLSVVNILLCITKSGAQIVAGEIKHSIKEHVITNDLINEVDYSYNGLSANNNIRSRRIMLEEVINEYDYDDENNNKNYENENEYEDVQSKKLAKPNDGDDDFFLYLRSPQRGLTDTNSSLAYTMDHKKLSTYGTSEWCLFFLVVIVAPVVVGMSFSLFLTGIG